VDERDNGYGDVCERERDERERDMDMWMCVRERLICGCV